VATPTPADPPSDGCVNALRLLIVDENARRAATSSSVLADLDLIVLHAGTMSEALVRSTEGGLIAVLIELRSSTIDGAALALAIRSMRPRIPIVFLAERSDDAPRLPQVAGERVDIYIRPVAPEWLRAKVASYEALYRNELRLRKLRLEAQRARHQKTRFAAALRRMQRHQALVNGALPVAFYCSPATGRGARRFIGGSVERVTGYSASDFLRRPTLWEDRIHPEDCETVLTAFADLTPGTSQTLDYRWRHNRGEDVYVVDHVSLGPEGDAAEIVGVWLDVSERRVLEIDRLHTSKLETVGRLTGGIAHDFNNMLAVTINSLEQLQSLTKQGEAWARTQDALHAARDCADLTRRLVHLSRRDGMEASMIDLREHLPIMLDLVKRSLGRRIEVELDIPDDLPPVSVVRAQLDSAVLNLALNARDAMPDGGRLTVSLAAHGADGQEAPSAGEADMIELAVSDTGVGMQPEVLEKALDPFFTTKDGTGTGLGLSMIQDFAEESGGEIKIESREGEGTTVRLMLPSANSSPA
jgi:signal transduction histidine kinase